MMSACPTCHCKHEIDGRCWFCGTLLPVKRTMAVELEVGERVKITDWSESACGEYGVVVVGEHPGRATGRPMVVVRCEGQTEEDEQGYYVEQVARV